MRDQQYKLSRRYPKGYGAGPPRRQQMVGKSICGTVVCSTDAFLHDGGTFIISMGAHKRNHSPVIGPNRRILLWQQQKKNSPKQQPRMRNSTKTASSTNSLSSAL